MAKQIVCNKCGKVFDQWDLNAEAGLWIGLGYGSKHDGEGCDLDLCLNCLDELIDSCVVSPLYEQNRGEGCSCQSCE